MLLPPIACKKSPQQPASWGRSEDFLVWIGLLVEDEGEQGYDARSLDGAGHRPLMSGAVAGNAAGQNFATLGEEPLQTADFFIIDMFYFIDAESADTTLGAASTRAAFTEFASLFGHGNTSFQITYL